MTSSYSIKAQPDPYALYPINEPDSSRGYWRLKTQAASRSTQIQFFGADRRLLYEENLPGQWVRLSRKNRKQFDQLLAQLVANQLLTTRIKTELLPSEQANLRPPSSAPRPDIDTTNAPIPASYYVHAYISQAGKLHLLISNPERLRYKIEIVDQYNRPLYEEFSNLYSYSRRLDLAPIPDTICRVIVHIAQKRFLYAVKRQNVRSNFILQPQLVAPQQPNLFPKPATSEQQFTPMPISL
ncbi:hypothetical protein [Spirosoma aerolatum]|uniref:hypothetical protein n=1 Tax=Spirosoma aerolatum TaxID=1211326 RepID=UPI0012D2C862|nr:hypothetical protein [Spirosoma aerolatum]